MTGPEMREHLLSSGGEIGALMRAFDWAGSPLGPLEAWPASLRTAFGLVVRSRFPMAVWWGRELCQLYNDAYRPLLGDKHPHALARAARDSWAEVWDVVGSLAEGVLRGGPATWNENLLLPLERKGFLEETYFTLSLSPIPADHAGVAAVGAAGAAPAVAGLLVTCTETTYEVQNLRQLRTLRDLGSALSEARSEEEVCVLAMRLLEGNDADLPFAGIYLTDAASGEPRLMARAGLDGYRGLALPERLAASSGPGTLAWPLAEAARAGQPVAVEGLKARLGALPGGRWRLAPDRAVLAPLAGPAAGRPAGFFLAGVSELRALDEGYRQFYQLIAEQLSRAMARARAYQDERRRAERLAGLDRAKTEFFSNVSLEFRSPLTLMLGPLEELQSDRHGPLNQRQRVQTDLVHRNALRLLKLVNNLLEFSRIEAHRAELCFEELDVAALTADLATAFRAAIERAGLRFEVECPRLPGPTWVDRAAWEKVVLNLLSNALKFTFSGTIVLRLRPAGEAFELEVADSGTGIPAEELPRLFERFHRIEAARARTQEGSGIGLALVQEIVRMHGGTVTATSQVDRGTSFTVRVPFGSQHLPRQSLAGSGARAASTLGAAPFVQEALRWLPDPAGPTMAYGPVGPVTPAPVAAGTAHILLAGDNPDMRAYLQRLLGQRWMVEVTSDGAAALAAARKRRPDLVVADVTRPDQDGFQLLRELRRDPELAAVPVLLLSARAGEESRLEGLEAGADDYLVKPFSPRELLARVNASLQMGKLRAAADRERKRLFGFFEQAPVPIAVLRGPEHVFDLANHEFQRVMNGRAMLGLPIRKAFPEIPEDADSLRLMDQVYRTGKAFSADDFRQDLDRGTGRLEEAYWMSHLHPLRDFDGRVEGVMFLLIEVTESVRARQVVEAARSQAEAANRTKDQFLAMLGHELRNPLTPILASLQLLRLRGSKHLVKERELIERQAKHLAGLVDDLLDVSRITQGKVTLQRKPVELADLVARGVEVASPLLEERFHQLRLDVPEGLVVNVDESRLVQVVSNLLTNAAKYTLPRGRIEVSASAVANDVLLVVRDNGEGISTELLPQIFDRFIQKASSSDRARGGLGLGLSIVRTIVELHEGQVSAASAGPGLGSAFTVRLPLARLRPARKRPLAAGPRLERGATGTNPRSILLVDDNRDIADVLAQLLRGRGHTVEVVYDGPAALALVQKFQPEVGLLDIGLPAMDGYELARNLRRLLPELTLVAVTGYGQSTDRRRSRQAGFSEHLVKPIDLERLFEMLEGKVKPPERPRLPARGRLVGLG